MPTATVEQVATVNLSSSSSEASEDKDIDEEVLEEVLDFDVNNFGNDNNTRNLFQKLLRHNTMRDGWLPPWFNRPCYRICSKNHKAHRIINEEIMNRINVLLNYKI